MDHDDVSQAAASDLDRLTAYTYLTVPDRRTYLAIMRVFTATLLADLSAHDVAERLPGSPLPGTDQGAEPFPLLVAERYNVFLHGGLSRSHESSPALPERSKSEIRRKIKDARR